MFEKPRDFWGQIAEILDSPVGKGIAEPVESIFEYIEDMHPEDRGIMEQISSRRLNNMERSLELADWTLDDYGFGRVGSYNYDMAAVGDDPRIVKITPDMHKALVTMYDNEFSFLDAMCDVNTEQDEIF